MVQATARRVAPAGEERARPGDVIVVCGALTDSLAVAGMTVGDVRRTLAVRFDIHPRATALVNGRAVSSRYRLSASEILEFVRTFGHMHRSAYTGSHQPPGRGHLRIV